MTHNEWVDYYNKVRAMADRIHAMKMERAYKIARAAGLPANPHLIHNARCDTNLSGWCKDSPEKLRAAKRANYILSDYSEYDLSRRISSRAFDKTRVAA